MDGVFLGLAGLLLGISLGLRPREIPRSSPASPRKTPSFPPLLLRLTHSISNRNFCCFSYIIAMVHKNSPTVEFWQERIEGNLRRANTEPSVDFRKANTEPSVHFRRANTETY